MGGPARPGAAGAPLRLSAQGSLAFATGSAPLAPDVVQRISGLAEEFAFDFAMYEWRLLAELGLSDRVSLEAGLPLRLSVTEARYRDSDGRTVKGLPSDDLHPEQRTESGFADATMDLRWIVYDAGSAWLSVQGGLSLPLGSTAPNPWLTADSYTGTVRRTFFGTGTLDPRLGLSAGLQAWGVDGTLWSRATLPAYENRWGYRAGALGAAGLVLSAGSAIGIDPLSASVSSMLRHAEQATWSGEPALNSGRTDVLVGAGLAWRISDIWSVDLVASRPVATWVEGGQVRWPIILTFGVYFAGGASDDGSAQQADRSAMDTALAGASDTVQGPPSRGAAIRP